MDHVQPEENGPAWYGPSSEPPKLVIGIDGGGTHTQAFLASSDPDASIQGRGVSGPSNIQSVGEERALLALDEAVSHAFADAGWPRQRVAAAALGLAGVDHPEAADVIRRWANRVQLAERVDIQNDATLLLAAGTPEGWGLAVIAGTGSIAFVRNRQGRLDRSGGWGYLLGDEGSAYGLALAGLRAVVRASDGCLPPTQLTDRLLGFMGLNEPLELIQAVYRGDWDRARLASLAPIVLQTAADGDTAARDVVSCQAEELAQTAAAAAAKLQLTDDRIPLALTGGTLLNDAHYLQVFLAAMRGAGIEPEPVTLVAEPAEGALRVARRLLRDQPLE